ncbi:MAG: hypothetical protein U9N80_07495, partial [Chloroflexota bacterium]|nr:hypothetical protein [Chloroflexota bacterium]
QLDNLSLCTRDQGQSIREHPGEGGEALEAFSHYHSYRPGISKGGRSSFCTLTQGAIDDRIGCEQLAGECGAYKLENDYHVY